MTAWHHPHPTCCAQAKRFIALRAPALAYTVEHPDVAAALTSYRATKPQWKIRALDADGLSEDIAISACPFCSAALPEVQLRAKPWSSWRIRTVIDGGYYCATCEERLMNCECRPAEWLWEAVR